MSNKSFSVTISNKIKNYKKTIQVDSDKSISIRSFLIGAISHNISRVKNVLESEDVFSTIKCLRKLGNSKIKTGYLPAAHTDYILAIIGEEYGFFGIFAYTNIYDKLIRHDEY